MPENDDMIIVYPQDGDTLLANVTTKNIDALIARINAMGNSVTNTLTQRVNELDATIGQVRSKVNALDGNTCKLTGTQTITGNKTFSGAVNFTGSLNILNWTQSPLSISTDWSGNPVDYSVSLSSYLPNDGHKYLVWASGAISATGKDMYVQIYTDVMTTARSFMRLDGDVSRASHSDNFVVVCVGSGRTLHLKKVGSGSFSSSSFNLFGYMRIA